MLLKTSFPYTGGFLCCPNKMVRFRMTVPGFLFAMQDEKINFQELLFVHEPKKADDPAGVR